MLIYTLANSAFWEQYFDKMGMHCSGWLHNLQVIWSRLFFTFWGRELETLGKALLKEAREEWHFGSRMAAISKHLC